MGILNIDEHVEEHRLMAIRYPNKAVIPVPIQQGIWSPPDELPARIDQAGYWIDAFTVDAAGIIALWEALRVAAGPSYITRRSLGADQSGSYQIYEYTLAPDQYDRTILISTGVHGSEMTGPLMVYRFAWHLVNSWQSYPELQRARLRTRFIILPAANPWGMSQSTRKRQNSRGVDICRNANYRWSKYSGGTNPFDHDYKGPSAASEVETQILQDWLASFASEAVAYVDVHNLGTSSGGNYMLYVPSIEPAPRAAMIELAKRLQSAGQTILIKEADFPAPYVWAQYAHKITALALEHSDGAYGGLIYSAVENTAALRWYGNAILKMLELPGKVADIPQPFVMHLSHCHGVGPSITTTSGSYADISALSVSFDAPAPGIIEFSGEIVMYGSAPCRVFVCPLFGQNGGRLSPTSHDATNFESYGYLNSTSDRETIPFFASFEVLATGVDNGQVVCGIRWYNDSGATLTLGRYRATVRFTPSDGATRARLFTTDTGNSVMTQKWPAL